jgi:hypothetical protein
MFYSLNSAVSAMPQYHLNNPEDIKHFCMQLNQFLRKKGITQSKQSLLLEGTSQILGYNSWNSCQGSLKQKIYHPEELVWDIIHEDYSYHYASGTLRFQTQTGGFNLKYYFQLSLNDIETILNDLSYLAYWEERSCLPINNVSNLKKNGTLHYGIVVKDSNEFPSFILETRHHSEQAICLSINHAFEKALAPFLAISQNIPSKGKPRDLKALKSLLNLSELLSFMRDDPLDRVLVHSDDLGPNDWYQNFSTRNDTTCFVVMSMKALKANTLTEMFNSSRFHGYENSARSGEIAVLGDEAVRDYHGRKTPRDIDKMIRDVENGVKDLPLCGVLYEGVWVLPEHPEAKSSEQIHAYILEHQSDNHDDIDV